MSIKCLFFLVFYIIENSRGYFQAFIADGKVAGEHEFPYCAHLLISCHIQQYWNNWICASSIINQRILMTTAHCLYSCNKPLISIRVGNSNIRKGNIFSYDKYIIHEKYNDFFYLFDIALVLVDGSLKLSSNIQRLALIKNPPLDDAYVAGWGVKEVSGLYSEYILRFAKQKFMSESRCLKRISFKPDGTICARVIQGQGFPSLGDSGGALVVRKFIQVGFVSYRVPLRNVTVYTYVPYFLNWININTKLLFC